jgi:hypothetical protein
MLQALLLYHTYACRKALSQDSAHFCWGSGCPGPQAAAGQGVMGVVPVKTTNDRGRMDGLR